MNFTTCPGPFLFYNSEYFVEIHSMTPNPFFPRKTRMMKTIFTRFLACHHIDDNAIERLKKYYRSLLRDDDAVLDPNSFQYNESGAFELLMKDS